MRTWWAWALGAAGLVAAILVVVALFSSASLVSGLMGRSTSEVAAAPGAGVPGEAPTATREAPVPPPPAVDQPPSPGVQRPEQLAQLLPPPEAGSWEATPIGARGRSMGRAGMDLEQGLADLQDALSACFTRRGQAGWAGKPVAEVRQPAVDDPGSTIVVLEVEASQGELRIHDAPVEARSAASDATLACLQDRLRRVRVPSEAPPPAPRFRMRFTVSP